uniref:CSON015171 protein n=1 Tax=Culicoides sonorensis TaxID=179676 RepID=A0A336LNW6_CULSO
MEESKVIHDQCNASVPKWTIEELRLLIASVKENPELYNQKHPKYKWFRHTENLWANFDLLLKKPPGSCKDRWAILRSTFRKEHTSRKDQSRWKLYSQMKFIEKFLYVRGPTLAECIQRALREQQKLKKEEPSSENDYDYDENEQMITVMSEIPDGVRNSDKENRRSNSNDISMREEPSYSFQYKCKEAEHDFTFAIPKLEPVSIGDHLQHMSTPINSPKKVSRVLKRRSSSENVFQIGNVKVRKLSQNSNKSEHYEVSTNNQENNQKLQKLSTNGLHLMSAKANDEKTNDDKSLIARQSFSSNSSIHACNCKADSDTMFMQSLIPDIKKLRSEDKMIFKVKIHQLLKDLLYKTNERR